MLAAENARARHCTGKNNLDSPFFSLPAHRKHPGWKSSKWTGWRRKWTPVTELALSGPGLSSWCTQSAQIKVHRHKSRSVVPWAVYKVQAGCKGWGKSCSVPVWGGAQLFCLGHTVNKWKKIPLHRCQLSLCLIQVWNNTKRGIKVLKTLNSSL